MQKNIVTISMLLVLNLMVCNGQSQSNSESKKAHLKQQTTNNMKIFVAHFEIPAIDFSRAISFYQNILDIKIESFEIPGMEMGIFPYEEQMVTGAIIKGEGYKPSSDGVALYLNGGDNLQIILDRVKENGGEIVVPKTPHADENGFFAMFLDTEGNKLGLNSTN